MKNLFLVLMISLSSAPAFASFEDECLPGLKKEISQREGVDRKSVKLLSTKIVKDVTRDKLCGLRVIHEVDYSYKTSGYKESGYSLILYTCGGCETIGDWVEFGN